MRTKVAGEKSGPWRPGVPWAAGRDCDLRAKPEAHDARQIS